MPETTELYINDCEKFISLADEYLHGELSEEEKIFADKHITGCKDCLDYIGKEKKYLEEIRLAEYIPERAVSQSVMDKIIENKMIINKPPRQRFMPIGFISAAAVVIIMFALVRGGPLNLFMKSEQDNNSANDSGGNIKNIEMYGLYDENEVMDAAGGDAEINRAFDLFVIEDDIAQYDGEAMPEIAGIMPAAVEPEESIYSSEMDEHIPKISGVQISEIYRFYYIGALNMPDEKRASITKDIEIYKTDEEFNVFDIFDKEYQETLENNLLENNIVIGEILNKEHDGKYIAVIYWSN